MALRFSMLEKGGTDNQSPHQLIMTATPIPRTLAMTVYGSLETSIIDEMPPGRKPVETSARPNSLREKVIKRIEEVCLSGQRVYWVCTLIEESEELEAQSAEELFKEISESLPKIDVGLVHGKLKKKSKEQVIKKFREGKIQLLVCTTVIEVGVDVPEASVGVVVSGSSGVREHVQRLGRILRHKEGKRAVLYEIVSKNTAEQFVNKRRRQHDAYQGFTKIHNT